MKDERIRYRDFERQALVSGRVRAFCLTRGNLRAAEMAELFLSRLDAMAAACAEDGTHLRAIYGRDLCRRGLPRPR